MDDEGVAIVVLEKQDKDTYRPIPGDPTSRQKSKLIQTLRDIKAQGGLNDYAYKRLYQPVLFPPSSMVYPQIHKLGTPSDPLLLAGVQ